MNIIKVAPVAAKGAKRPYSQLRPVLLPFQRLTALLRRAPRSGVASVPPSAALKQYLSTSEWRAALASRRGAAELAAMGVEGIFGPGSSLEQIIGYIRDKVPQERAL